VKVAYLLTDVRTAEDGALMAIPGSHVRNHLPRPGDPNAPFDDPDGVEPILAPAGSAVVFDRRLWHARGENRSQKTRKALFVAFTYRWIRPRETVRPIGFPGLSPVRRQLLGEATDELGYWLPTGGDAPLRSWLRARDLLDADVPHNR
jgi:ectoine hydroxylase-related dioxygenase (phytanoyl-CoA dioxygenase family)